VLDHSYFFIIEFDPLSGVTMAYKTVVMTSSRGVPMVDDHPIKFIRVSALDSRVFQARQQRVHCCLRVKWHIVLVTIDFFIGELPIQVILIEAESEWELNIIG